MELIMSKTICSANYLTTCLYSCFAEDFVSHIYTLRRVYETCLRFILSPFLRKCYDDPNMNILDCKSTLT